MNSHIPALVRMANALLMMGLPLLLGSLLARRLRARWGLFGIGALTFAASQALHLPFNRWLLQPATQAAGLTFDDQALAYVLLVSLYALSAGAFEEVARYLVLRLWVKPRPDWSQALMVAAGHGGLEAILLGLLAMVGLFQALALRSNPASMLSAEQLARLMPSLQAYWTAPSSMALLGAVERALALALHLSLGVLVLQAVRRNQLRWLLAAIGWHALANAVTLIVLRSAGPYAAEGSLAILALASLGLVFALGDSGATLPSESLLEPLAAGTPAAGQTAPGLLERRRKELLDESRYHG